MQKIIIKPILMLSAVLVALYSAIFLLPNHIELLAFIPQKFFAGEIWRFVTFPFTHLSDVHLIENAIGVIMVGAIASELKTRISDFSFVYFLSGSLAIVPILTVMSFVVLGASAAIYGALGLLLLEAARFGVRIEHVGMFLAFILAGIFANSVLTFFSCGLCESLIFNLRQAAVHFSGFVFGAALFLSLGKINYFASIKKRQVLRGITYG